MVDQVAPRLMFLKVCSSAHVSTKASLCHAFVPAIIRWHVMVSTNEASPKHPPNAVARKRRAYFVRTFTLTYGPWLLGWTAPGTSPSRNSFEGLPKVETPRIMDRLSVWCSSPKNQRLHNGGGRSACRRYQLRKHGSDCDLVVRIQMVY